MRKTTTIECPYCHTQYLPAEIYVPNAFFGRPKHIEKEYSGRIIDFDGESLNLNEQYICDKCNTQFNVKARITFEASRATKHNINEQYTVQLKKSKLLLDED